MQNVKEQILWGLEPFLFRNSQDVLFFHQCFLKQFKKKERKTTEVSEWAFCSEPRAWLWLPEALQTPAYKVLIPKVTAAMVPLGLPPWSGPGHTAQQAQLPMRRSPLRSPAAKQMLETISVKQNKNVTKYREVLKRDGQQQDRFSYRCSLSEQVLTAHVGTGKSSNYCNQEVEYGEHNCFDWPHCRERRYISLGCTIQPQ